MSNNNNPPHPPQGDADPNLHEMEVSDEDEVGRIMRDIHNEKDVLNKTDVIETEKNDKDIDEENFDDARDTLGNGDALQKRIDELAEDVARKRDEEKKKENRTAQKQRRELTNEEKTEEEECLNWFSEGVIDRFRPPVPRYLLLKDGEGRKYTGQDVMRRTAWMAKALDVRSRELLPQMKRITFKDVNYISITAEPSVVKKLLTIKQLGPCNVEIYKDPRRNSINGVIYDGDKLFSELSEDGVKSLLSNKGVTYVRRLTKGKDKVPTDAYKLTFDAFICPDGFAVDGYWYKVKPFVEQPLRCFRCQRYEHNAKKCRSKQPVCQRCGQVGHQSREFDDNQQIIWSCHAARKCYNCEQDHEAGFTECATQKAHWKINELMARQQISRYEAKERIMPRGPRTTDAQIVFANIESRERIELNREDKGNKALEALERKVDRILEKEAVVRVDPEGILLAELSNKLDQFLQVCKPSGAPAVGNDAEEHSTRQSDESMRKEMDRKFADVHARIQKHEKKIEQLQKDNDRLRREKEELMKERDADRKEKEELAQQVRALKKEISENQKRGSKRNTRSPSHENHNQVAKKIDKQSTPPRIGRSTTNLASTFGDALSGSSKTGARGNGHSGGTGGYRGARGGGDSRGRYPRR